MTKSHKLFQLINQISVTCEWGHTCRGKDWASSCPFYLWLCCVASGWHEQRGILSYIELTLLSDTSLTQPSHPQCLIGYQPLDAPAKPVFTFSSPKPRRFTDPAFNNSWVVSAFCDTLLHLPPSFWIVLLCCFSSSIHKSQHKPARGSEAEDGMSVILSLSSSPFECFNRLWTVMWKV